MDGMDGIGERIAIRVTPDGMSCALVILPGPAESVPRAFEAIAILEAEGISGQMLDQNAVEFVLEQARAAPDKEQRAEVARGTPAVDETRASFTLDPELTERLASIYERQRLLRSGESTPPGGAETTGANELSSEPDPDDGTAGRGGRGVDFRADSSFVEVGAGDRLGTITPSIPGRDGVNVRGDPVPHKRTPALNLKGHRSVLITDDGVIAANPGVLRIEPAGVLINRNAAGHAEPNRVMVDPVLEIQGGVGYETGNISFTGDVVVYNGIKDHFRLDVGQTLTVRGLVEAAHIRCERDASIEHGMAGREIGTLDILGDLTAGYLDGVSGTVRGTLSVRHEIKGCRLRVGRRIVAPDCALFGGEVYAEQEIDVGVLGGPGGAETAVGIGTDEQIAGLSDRLSGLLATLQQKRERGETEYKALQQRLNSLTPTQAERLTELLFEQTTNENLEQRIAIASGDLLEAAKRWSPAVVRTSRAVHKGVRIRLRHVELRIKQSVLGVAEFSLDKHGEPVCRLNNQPDLTPIGSIATVSSAADPLRLLHDTAESGRSAM